MKKIFVFIACLALVLFTAGVVSGATTPPPIADLEHDSQTSTDVYLTVDSYYVLHIDASVSVSSDSGEKSYMLVGISNVKVPVNQCVNVTVSSDQFDPDADPQKSGATTKGLWELWETSDTTGQNPIRYHIHREDEQGDEVPIKSGDSVYQFTSGEYDAYLGTNPKSHVLNKELFFELDAGITGTVSGTYKDTLLFTACVDTYNP